jgi:phospholipase C
VHAFLASPQFQRGALFIVYDEGGGFFDHVRPPRVPDRLSARDIGHDFGQMGFRIPAVAVSPYARRGHVDHGIYGFESILAMIRYRFGLEPLTRRDAFARNIARSFDFESNPRLDIPDLPTPPQVIASSCQGGIPVPNPGLTLLDQRHAKTLSSPVAKRPKPHDLAALYTSGYLERLGFKYRPATPATTFRHPSSLGLRP